MKLNSRQAEELSQAIQTSRKQVIQKINAFDTERRELYRDVEDDITLTYEQAYQTIRKEMVRYTEIAQILVYQTVEQAVSLDSIESKETWRKDSIKKFPLFTTTQEVSDYFKLCEIRRPLPRIVKLKQDKQLVITKLIGKPLYDWTIKEEQELQSIKKDPRNAKGYQTGSLSAPANRLNDLRGTRRAANSRVTSITMVRGPFKAKSSSKELSIVAVRNNYIDLRRKISHERTRVKQMQIQNGHFGFRVAGTYTLPGGVLDKTKSKIRSSVQLDKSPNRSTPHVGVELEFCSKSSVNKIIDALIAAGLKDNVTLKADGSLRISAPGDKTHELTLLATEKQYPDIINRVCKVLKDTGGYVNKTCGLHVHLDMRRRQPEMAYERLIKSLEILYRMTPPERRYNKYCQRNASDMIWNPRQETRYWAINPAAYEKHQTIEVRLHSGSLNPLKINNWIKLLLLIISTPNTVFYRGPERFIAAMKVPPELAAYIMLRIAKFDQEGEDYEDDHVKQIYDPLSDRRPLCACHECQSIRTNEISRCEDNIEDAS